LLSELCGHDVFRGFDSFIEGEIGGVKDDRVGGGLER
jgi:hypothetical protein